MIPAHFITAHDAAERIGLGVERVKHRIRAGDFPSAVKGDHNAWWLDPADLLLASAASGKGRDFWSKVEKDECWTWTGRIVKGYGQHAGRLAHRLAYEEVVGPIPDGMQLDHLCRNPPCVRPDHLEPVTRLENVRRHYDTITHCKRGHEFTEANTYMAKGKFRSCRKCQALSQQRYQARKRAS